MLPVQALTLSLTCPVRLPYLLLPGLAPLSGAVLDAPLLVPLRRLSLTRGPLRGIGGRPPPRLRGGLPLTCR